MSSHIIDIYDTDLAREQSLPANTSVIGNCGGQSTGGLLGHTTVVMVAASPVTLNAGKSIYMALEDSDDNKVFTPMHTSTQQLALFSLCKWDTFDVIARLTLPSRTREYVRVIISTDDEAVTGQVSVMLDYLPFEND